MSPDLLAFLFLVTSTAIVLGVAVTLRGLHGFVSDGSTRLPEPQGDTSGDAAGSSISLDGSTEPGATAPAMAAPAMPAVRDLREPLVMMISGVFIVSGALIALATLINSAP